jgi:predicted anti-sigma-YlaC factor YlaD
VSILDRMIPNRHVADAVLAEIWAESVASGTPAAHQHLQTCAECRARYDELCVWAQSVRTEDLAAADAAFPAERLAAQQSQILRRLEALERPARVIAFPKFAQPVSGGRSVAYRWVAAAAAAGLVIGVALGQWLDLSQRFDRQPAVAETQLVASPPASSDVRLQTASAISDDALLSDLEASAAMHPSVAPLRAIDALTPRSRDFVQRRR